MTKAKYKKINYEKIKGLCENIFEKYGFSEADAKVTAEILLRADLYGIESHGIQRLIRYHNAVKDGEVEIGAVPEIVHETPVSATIDAKKAMGQVVGRNAMQLAMDKAKKSGIGMVAVRNSNHYGIAGYYSLMATKEDLIGVCMTNTEAIMVPTFSSQAILGTNPISVAMPADPTPMMFDAATTVVPRGKLEVYNKRGEPLPNGWALDEDGRDCTDTGRVLSNIIGKKGGGIAPLGGTSELTSGHKGYGFGLICELFTSIMAGGLTSNRCVTETINLISHCFWAIDYGIFGDKQSIKDSFSVLLEDLRGATKAEGHDRIYIHGEKEFESYQANLKDGVSVNEKTFDEIKMISKGFGLDYAPCIGEDF